jgi:hypothetical protein
MSLEVYYPTDIRNALLAAEQAVNAAASATGKGDVAFAAGFLVGYRAALTTIALAFGLARHSTAVGPSRWWQIEPEAVRERMG